MQNKLWFCSPAPGILEEMWEVRTILTIALYLIPDFRILVILPIAMQLQLRPHFTAAPLKVPLRWVVNYEGVVCVHVLYTHSHSYVD